MSLKIIRDDVKKVLLSLKALTDQEVMVGIPSTRTERDDSGVPINNATIGYIMENGSPANNIPARPHLVPGIKAVQPQIVERLRRAAIAGVSGKPAEVNKQMDSAGMIAASSVKALVNAGIEPALSESTLRARRGRKGAMWELAWREAGAPAGVELAKPLVDTGQYRNSITYVRRKR